MLFLLPLATLAVVHSYGQTKSLADLAFKATYENLPNGEEGRDLARRARGLAFWKAYPKDLRRYEWLASTIDHEPRYAVPTIEADACFARQDYAAFYRLPVDAAAKARWERQYRILRAEMLADPGVSSQDKGYLLTLEAMHRLFDARSAFQYLGRKPDVAALQREVLQCARGARGYRFSYRAAAIFADSPEAFGLQDPARQGAFWAAMAKSPNAYLSEFALGRVRVARLVKTPLEMRFVAMDGTAVDLGKLRGKVVLVDFWNVDCGICIEAMPRLKALRAKYGAAGFEVVGVCLSPDGDRSKADAIQREIEPTWSTWFTGGKDAQSGDTGEIRRRLSIRSVPVTLLLGRDGRLIASNPEHRSLEATIRKALGLDGK